MSTGLPKEESPSSLRDPMLNHIMSLRQMDDRFSIDKFMKEAGHSLLPKKNVTRQDFISDDARPDSELSQVSDRLPVIVEFSTTLDSKGIEDLPKQLTVDATSGNWLSGWATLEAIGELEKLAGVEIHFSREFGTPSSESGARAGQALGAEEYGIQLKEFRNAHPKVNAQQCVVAVIDLGIELKHETFLDLNGRSRIIAVWDQTRPGSPPPGFNYGTYYDRKAIDRISGSSDQSYELGFIPSHGTQVASLAVGKPVGNFPGGLAQGAKLIVVVAKIDSPRGDPVSVGYSKSHFDALKFIENESAGVPLVVNVSSGMNAGAHDGSSPLERWFDSFTLGGTTPGRVVVKSAGNDHLNSLKAVVHTLSNSESYLTWESMNVPRWQDYLELWFSSIDDHEFTLITPSGSPTTPMLSSSNPLVQTSFAGESVTLQYDRFFRDNGMSRVTAIIQQKPPAQISYGPWQLKITTKSLKSGGKIDAWFENVDPSNCFVKFDDGVDRETTISIPATADSVIAVGAAEKSRPTLLARTSGRGPTRDSREKPDLLALGSNLVAATSGGPTKTTTVNGSSMSAPIVTGGIALILSRSVEAKGPLWNARQVNAALRQTSTGYRGFWNSGHGCGLFNLFEADRALNG
jgi:endonuclease G